MLTRLVLKLIHFYQTHLSPYKGFSCAYRVGYGGSGCSGVGIRLIRRYGTFSGSLLLRKRLARCRFAAYELHEIKSASSWGYAKYQRGECDVPCDGDCGKFNSCDLLSDLNAKCKNWIDSSCCDCSCDWGNSKEKEKPKKKRLEMPNLHGLED